MRDAFPLNIEDMFFQLHLDMELLDGHDLHTSVIIVRGRFGMTPQTRHGNECGVSINCDPIKVVRITL